MIVMPFVGHVIVLRLRAEVTGLRQPDFTEQIERSINSRQTDVWDPFSRVVDTSVPQ